jgi:hypothetical protein
MAWAQLTTARTWPGVVGGAPTLRQKVIGSGDGPCARCLFPPECYCG